jgi:hypothetical protein
MGPLRRAPEPPAPHRRARAAAVAICFVVALGAAGAQDVASVDPCALLTDDEVAAVFGAIDQGGTEDALPTTSLRQCSWITSGGERVLFGGLVLQVMGVRDGSREALIARLEGDRFFPLDAHPIPEGPVPAAYAVDPDEASPTVFLVAAIVGGLQVTLVPGESPEVASPAFAGLLDLLWMAVARVAD